jgi:hypothetical protein
MPVFTSSIEVTADYPTIKPSLNLNFARSRSLDPRITFTRASVGTYVGRDGLIKTAGVDEARFDHDPDTLESLGLLIEEQRTNSIAYSDGIGSGWGGNGVTLTTINSVNGPDGIAGVTEIRDNNSNSYHAGYYGTVPVDGSSNYTVSAWLKKGPNYRSDIGSGGRFQIYCDRGTGSPASVQITFNFDTLVGQNNVTSSSLTQYPNGWIRVTFTFTSNAAANVTPHFLLGNGGQYQGDATNSVYLWGAQIEAGTFPTSYIPTSGSSATRTQDNASITGASFNNFYNQTEGTIVSRFKGGRRFVFPSSIENWSRVVGYGPGNKALLSSGNTGNNHIHIYNGTQVHNIFLGPDHINGFTTAAVGFGSNSATLADAGYVAETDAGGWTTPTVDKFVLGNDGSGQYSLNGYIDKIHYYPQRLTNAQLQLLTS